jgi:hypothetical protein
VQVKSFGRDTLVAQIHAAVKAANDAGEIIFGVDLSKGEYDQLRKDLDRQGDLTHVPPSGVPVYVEGKSMTEEVIERAVLLRSLGNENEIDPSMMN